MNNIGLEGAECLGSGLFISSFRAVLLDEQWTGECPECGQVLELGYAGSLPVHAVGGEATRPPPGG
jgi:hypothetical protein